MGFLLLFIQAKHIWIYFFSIGLLTIIICFALKSVSLLTYTCLYYVQKQITRIRFITIMKIKIA